MCSVVDNFAKGGPQVVSNGESVSEGTFLI